MPRGKTTGRATRKQTARILQRIEEMARDVHRFTTDIRSLAPADAKRAVPLMRKIETWSAALCRIAEDAANRSGDAMPYDHAQLPTLLAHAKFSDAVPEILVSRVVGALRIDRTLALPEKSQAYRQVLDRAVALLQKRRVPDIELARHLAAAGYSDEEANPHAIAARAHRLRAKGIKSKPSAKARNKRRPVTG